MVHAGTGGCPVRAPTHQTSAALVQLCIHVAQAAVLWQTLNHLPYQKVVVNSLTQRTPCLTLFPFH